MLEVKKMSDSEEIEGMMFNALHGHGSRGRVRFRDETLRFSLGATRRD